MKELTEWDFDIPRDNRFEAWPLKEIRKGNAEMNYSFNADYREVAKRMQRHNSLRDNKLFCFNSFYGTIN